MAPSWMAHAAKWCPEPLTETCGEAAVGRQLLLAEEWSGWCCEREWVRRAKELLKHEME